MRLKVSMSDQKWKAWNDGRRTGGTRMRITGGAVALLCAISGGWGTDALARHRKKTVVDVVANAIEEKLVTAPQDQEVCFSPDERCDVKFLKFVSEARKSLDIAIYDINLDELVHQILVLSRKIPVRVLVDRRQARGRSSLVPLLIKGGVNVRYGHQRGIMHNKFAIVDGRMVEVGSFNYTHHAAQANNENQIYLANPQVVARYQKRFQRIWDQGDPASSSDGS